MSDARILNPQEIDHLFRRSLALLTILGIALANPDYQPTSEEAEHLLLVVREDIEKIQAQYDGGAL